MFGSFAEGIEDRHIQPLKVIFITGNDGKAMDAGCGRNHRILDHIIGFLIHEARPFAEACGVHGKHLVSFGNLVHPAFNLIRFCRILATSEFDTSLQLFERDR